MGKRWRLMVRPGPSVSSKENGAPEPPVSERKILIIIQAALQPGARRVNSLNLMVAVSWGGVRVVVLVCFRLAFRPWTPFHILLMCSAWQAVLATFLTPYFNLFLTHTVDHMLLRQDTR